MIKEMLVVKIKNALNGSVYMCACGCFVVLNWQREYKRDANVQLCASQHYFRMHIKSVRASGKGRWNKRGNSTTNAVSFDNIFYLRKKIKSFLICKAHVCVSER